MTWCAPVSVRPSIDALTTTWWKYGPFGSLIGPPPELAVGVHETTVSRAIANKYIRTPHGVFDFKYFFTPGYQADSGAAVSNKSVKEMISELIDLEDRAKPLSDQDLVAKLQEKGINIARRTVAKYREELGLLPSNLRRDYT